MMFHRKTHLNKAHHAGALPRQLKTQRSWSILDTFLPDTKQIKHKLIMSGSGGGRGGEGGGNPPPPPLHQITNVTNITNSKIELRDKDRFFVQEHDLWSLRMQVIFEEHDLCVANR